MMTNRGFLTESLAMPHEAPMTQEENHLWNVIAGTLLGGLCGGGIGLGACTFIFDEPHFFTGDTISHRRSFVRNTRLLPRCRIY